MDGGEGAAHLGAQFEHLTAIAAECRATAGVVAVAAYHSAVAGFGLPQAGVRVEYHQFVHSLEFYRSIQDENLWAVAVASGMAGYAAVGIDDHSVLR